MEGVKRTLLSVRKKPKRKNTRLVTTSIVSYLKSDAYLFAPLFSKFSPLPPQIQMPPPSTSVSSKADVTVKKNKKRRLTEKVKEYLNSDCHMYRPMISLPKPGSSFKGKLQITNSVMMEVSKSNATMREDNNNYRYLRSDTAQHALPNRTGLNRETDLSPPFSPLQEQKMVQPHSRRVPIE